MITTRSVKSTSFYSLVSVNDGPQNGVGIQGTVVPNFSTSNKIGRNLPNLSGFHSDFHF